MPTQIPGDNLSLPPKLSERAMILWGKSGDKDSDLWLPLYVHLTDAIEVAKLLWNEWVPPATKKAIARGIRDPKTTSNVDESEEESIEIAKWTFILLVAFHDIGKATPIFQKGSVNRFRRNNAKCLAERVEQKGLLLSVDDSASAIPHSLSSFGILLRNNWDERFAVIVGAHHGKPPSKDEKDKIVAAYKDETGFNNDSWRAVQDELVEWAERQIEPDILEQVKACHPTKQAQVLLAGLVIMADWIASDERWFSLIQIGMRTGSSAKRAHNAWENLDLIPYQEFSTFDWQSSQQGKVDEIYQLRFSRDTPRPLQREIVTLLGKVSDPGIVIIEAPMGEGKTEAALVAAELLARRTGRSGIFFALPTQATSDGIFERILKWTKRLDSMRSITLAHGKAHLNEEFQGLSLAATNANDGEDTVFVSDWAHGRKRAILSDFVVGTIDQVLMAGLKQKHLMLRHLGLIGKVAILDECHAYDTYMSQYLYKVLEWLGAYKVPVVVLSATLPADRRHELIRNYLNMKARTTIDDPLAAAFGKTGESCKKTLAATIAEKAVAAESTTHKNVSTGDATAIATSLSAYPLITYSSGQQVLTDAPPASSRTLAVKIVRLDDEDIIPGLEKALADGGCAGIIVNTVTRAQNLARQLFEVFGEKTVVLFHSRFIASDRAKKEKTLRKMLGSPDDTSEKDFPDVCQSGTKRPEKLVVVGTQVLEQSLDIDFDILITDICPMDLLMQRIGRLHRHAGRIRPASLQEPSCYVTGIEGEGRFHRGSEFIYGAYMLMNTQALLPERIVLPGDISRLVQAAYDERGTTVAESVRADYQKARDEHEKLDRCARQKAMTFQIGKPFSGKRRSTSSIIDWLNTDLSNDSSGKRAEATVRDTADSIEVLVIIRRKNGELRTLPWLEKYGDCLLPDDFATQEWLAQTVSGCTVNLPPEMCKPWIVDNVIATLEKDCCKRLPGAWQQSPWLRGELFLILDENLSIDLCVEESNKKSNFRLWYDMKYGLCLEKDGD